MDAPVTPFVTSVKSVLFTPVTLSLNVTVNCTLARLLVTALTRVMDWQEGAVLSTVIVPETAVRELASARIWAEPSPFAVNVALVPVAGERSPSTTLPVLLVNDQLAGTLPTN